MLRFIDSDEKRSDVVRKRSRTILEWMAGVQLTYCSLILFVSMNCCQWNHLQYAISDLLWYIDDSQSDAASDDEDDDEEEDQDILEADLDKNELLKAHEVDLIGDKFLITNYSEPTNGAQRKKRVC